MTTMTPPLEGGYFPPENGDDPYGLAQFSQEYPETDLDALRRRVHGEQP